MAVPAHRALGSTVHAANNVPNPTNLTPTKGGSTVNGDLLICWTWCRSITATVSTPSGWNLVSGFPKRSGTASGGSIYCFTRIADGSGSDAPTVTWTGVTTGTSGDTSSAVILSVQNAVETIDHSAIAFSDLAAQTNTSTIPDVTTLDDQAYAVHLTFKFVESGTSTQTTYTERTDAVTTNGTGNCSTTGSVTKATAGAVGTGTVTWSNTTSARGLSCAIAFRNAPTTVTITPAGTTDAPQADMFPQAPTNPTISWGTAGTGGTSATCSAPQVTEGDLLLLAYRSIAGTAFSPTITGGANGQWTLLYSDDSGSSSQGRGSIYAKIAEVGDGGTYTVDGPNVGANDHVVVNVARVRVGRGNVISRVKNTNTDAPHDASASSHSIGGITTKKDNDLVVLIVTGDGALGRDTYTATDPATLTEDMQQVTATGLDGFIVSASALRTTKGATGTVSYNSTTAATADGARTLLGITTASFIEKPKTVTQAEETDSAVTIFVYKLGVVSETDSAQALSIVHFVTITQAGETDSARPLSLTGVTLGVASETDVAEALDYFLDFTGYLLDPAEETSSAQALSFYKSVTITQVGETATAPAETASKSLDVTRAVEVDAAQAQSFHRAVDLVFVAESDSVVSLTGGRLFDISPASESDAAIAQTFFRSVTITPVIETDMAVTPIRVSITPVTETTTVIALVVTKPIVKSISPAPEIDAARIQHFHRSVDLTPASETDSVLQLIRDRIVYISPVEEASEAVALVAAKVYDLTGAAVESDAAISVGHHFEFIGGSDGHIVTGGVLTGSEPEAREGYAESPDHGAEPLEGGVRLARKGYVF